MQYKYKHLPKLSTIKWFTYTGLNGCYKVTMYITPIIQWCKHLLSTIFTLVFDSRAIYSQCRVKWYFDLLFKEI